MPTWRETLRFAPGEDPSFDQVHERYRERMLTLTGAIGLDDVSLLAQALEEARRELAPTQRPLR